MRHKKIWILIVLCGLFGSRVQEVDAKESLSLHALSAVVMEEETGRIVYAKDAGVQRAMASTTKIMTLLVALENADVMERVTVSENAASQPKVHMNMKAGESYRLIDLLYAMMLVSYNDTAVAIAEHIGGSVEAFCEMMTQRAQQIGAMNTQFRTPNGLDAEGHYSTALDMAWILREVIQNEKAVEIMRTTEYVIEPDEGHSSRIHLVNKNPMLSSYEGTICGKTGYTGEAGLCLVNAAQRDGITLITVVLGAGWPPDSSFRVTDTRKMLQYGFDNFYMKEYTLDGMDTGNAIAVQDGDQKCVATQIQGDFRYYVSKEDPVEILYDLPYVISAPVRAGEVLGTARILIDQKTAVVLPVISSENVIKTDVKYYLKQLLYQIGIGGDYGRDEASEIHGTGGRGIAP